MSRPWKVFVHDVGPATSFADEFRARDRAASLVSSEYAKVSVYDASVRLYAGSVAPHRTLYRCDVAPVEQDLVDGRWTDVGPYVDDRALRRSDLFAVDAALGRVLWNDGFRPVDALELRAGDVIACWDTDVFRLGTVGPVRFTTAVDVRVENYLVTVATVDRGDVEIDDGTEVWVKR